MNQPRVWKNLPTPVRVLIRPMLFLSLGLHALLLLLPLPPQSEPEPDSLTELLPEEQMIKVVPTPKGTIAPTPPKPAPPTPAAPPSPAATRPITPPPRSQSTQPPIVTAPAPTPQLPTTEASPTPTPTTPDIALTPLPPAEPEPEETTVTGAFDDFPNPEGVVGGCLRLNQCQQAEGVRLTQLVQDLQTALRQQGYTVTALDVDEDQGRRVFAVTKGEETRYLNLFSTPEGAMYLLAEQILTLADVQAMATAREQLVNQVQGLSRQSAQGPNFAQPNLFFTEVGLPKEGLEPYWPLVANQTPDRLWTTQLAPQLQQQGFNIAPLPDYAGGPLYQVQQGGLVYYVSLVPAAGGQGTIVTLWSQLPKP